MRPDGKELYVYGIDSPFILVVDIDSADYPVIGKIQLPGKRAVPIPYISFSRDGTHAYISRARQCIYEESCTNFSDFTKIIVIDTTKKNIKREIPMPRPFSPTAAVVPSLDGKWLYFTVADNDTKRLGVGKLSLESQKVDINFLPLEGVQFITLSGDGKFIYATQGWNLFGPPKNLFTIIDATTFRVVASVTVGDGPRYVAVTPDGRKAYVSNQWSDDVSVIDLETMKVTATIEIGPEPRVIAITPDGSKAYVALPAASGGMGAYQFGNMVAVIDVKRDILLTRIGVHIEPESIAMDPDGTRAYVSDGNSNGWQPSEVHVIDTEKDVYLRPIILRRAAHFTPTAIDTTPDGKRLFVVSEASKSLLVIDTATGSILDRLNLQPQGVKVSADGTKVYVFSPQKLFVINSDSFEVVKSIDLSQVFPAPPRRYDSEAFRIVVNRAEDTAYLLGISKEVVVVNLTSGEVVAKIPFAEQSIRIARGLALTPDESRLLVSDYHSRTVAIIDTSTKTVVVRVPVASTPSEIKMSKDGKRAYVLQQHSTTMMTIIDIKTQSVLKSVGFPAMINAALDFELSQDERYAYIACFDPNFIMVYDLQENKLAKVIDTGLDPFNTAMTPDRKYIYVTEFTSDSISVVDTTTNSIARTFKLDETSK